MKLSGAKAVITGGGSGLGLATARAFARAGAKVALMDVDESTGVSAAANIGAFFCCVDVSDEESVTEGVKSISDFLGGISTCVNCAGIAAASAILGRKRSQAFRLFEKTVAINLSGTYNVIRAVVPVMAENQPNRDGERGVIVNTASIAAFEGQPGQAAYAASKSGIAGMSVPLARELASRGIRVNAIAPGIFDTPMLHGLPSPDLKERLAADVVFPNRLGNPDEFASLAKFLVQCAYMNGETVRIDAGLRMPKSVSV